MQLGLSSASLGELAQVDMQEVVATGHSYHEEVVVEGHVLWVEESDDDMPFGSHPWYLPPTPRHDLGWPQPRCLNADFGASLIRA